MRGLLWIGGAFAAAMLVTGCAGAGYWYAQLAMAQHPALKQTATVASQAPGPERHVAYYQDPTGKPDFSPEPKKDAQRRDYVPVYDETADAPPSASATPQAPAI